MNKLPSNYDIACYWYDKIEQEYKAGIDIRKKYPNKMWADFGEPDCWACGVYATFNDIHGFIKTLKPIPEKITDKHFKLMWNASGLERHHILPKSRDGSDDVSNLFLLCHICHKSCPHTANTDYFWEWVRNREKERDNEYANAGKEAIKLAGLSLEKNEKFIHLVLTLIRMENHPANKFYKKIQKDMSQELTFHPFSDPTIYFRDELACALSLAVKHEFSTKQLQEILDDIIDSHKEKLNLKKEA